METLLAQLLSIAEEHPKRIALCSGSERVTYEEFRARILKTAGRLRAWGVSEGDRVLICANNTPVVPILYFAVHALGAIAAPVAPDTPECVLGTLVADAEAKLAVIEKAVKDIPCAIVSPAVIVDPTAGGDEIEPRCDGNKVADLLYTSGTTGRKKGVVLTQANILAAARNITEFIGNRADDIEVVPLPLSHSFGLGRLRSLAVTGHTLVLEQGVGTGAPLVKRILETRATGFALVPAGFDIIRRMTGDVLGQARDHLRYIEIGSAAIKPDTRRWLTEMLPHTRICHHYGLTEASRAAFVEYHSDSNRVGSVGRAAPNVEIFICDERGNRLQKGQIGEVVVRGGMVMQEYWKQPELTEQAFCEQGLKTGDIGCLDGDGYLTLLGRRGDLINVGGRKVAPDEIEDLLCQLDGVRDAGCVGVPDELLGECVKAYLVTDRNIGRAEVAAFLRSRLEEWKIPQSVERIDSVPRTSSGKIQRQLLRQAKETEWTA